jgi:DNA-binding NarL/FixJ family response regulator
LKLTSDSNSAAACPGRVVVADDDVLVREGIASVLTRAGYDVVGQVADGTALIEAIRRSAPDLAIVDIRMPPSQMWEGIDVARAIRREYPQIGILLLSAYVELETALDLLEDGERIGYLLKSRVTRGTDVVDALGRISEGGSVIDPALVQELVKKHRRADPLGALTPREGEVLALVAEGRSNSAIGHQLWISEGAVEKHVRSILGKLELPTTADDHRRVLAVLTYLDAT